MYDTHRLPLSIQMEVAHANGALVSTLNFYLDALEAGWSHDKAVRVIDNAFFEVFGSLPRGPLL